MNLKSFKSWFKKKPKSEDSEFVAKPKSKPNFGTLKVGTIFRALFFFLLVTVPLGIFAYIIYHSSGLGIYQNYTYAGHHIWYYMSVPNASEIFILFWVGMGCLIATAIMICLFGVVTRNVYDKRWQTAYVFGIIVLAVIGVLLAALSQYFYAKFYDFYLYEARTSSDTNIQDWAKDLSQKLTSDWNRGNGQGIFDWMQSAIVWWVMFVQFMVLFGVGITLQNALNSKGDLNDYEKYIADTKQEDAGIDFSKVNRFFRNMFNNNDKNIAKFLVVIALVVIIPNFVYSIIGTVETSNMSSVIGWGYKVPVLIHDLKIEDSDMLRILKDLDQAKYGSSFLAVSLPIIFEGLTIATVFFFIAMLLRGKNVSNRIFIVESSILLAELVVLIAVSFVSKVYVHRLADFWQMVPEGSKQSNIQIFTSKLESLFGAKGNDDYKAMTEMYPLNGITNSSYIEWLPEAATIAEVIIAYAWTFGTFALITNDIYKLGYFKKAKATTYTSGILNS